MKVWIVKEGEPFPMLTGNGRLMRSGMIAQQFAEEGNDVIWWSSSWLHQEKCYYCRSSKNIKLSNNLELKLLYSRFGYKKNISVKRIIYYKILAQHFKESIYSNDTQKPDIIYCSWPIIELSYLCIEYGRENRIPVIIDIRDFWPDIFVQPFHGSIKRIVSLLVSILYKRQTKYVMQNATRIIGVIPKALLLAKKYGRTNFEKDHCLYLCFNSMTPNSEKLNAAYSYWQSLNITNNTFNVIYIGNISSRIGLFDDIINISTDENLSPKVKIILCGNGEDLSAYQEKVLGKKNILFVGYKNSDELYALKTISKIGLLPYKNTDDFIDSLPNKFGEYLAGGLPIVTTLSGLSKTMIENNFCGKYASDNNSLITIINNYVNDNELWSREHKNALQLFHSTFDSSIQYPAFVEECNVIVSSWGNN